MVEIIQGTPEWHALRLGKVTASRVADVIAKTKSGYSASRANYLAELVVERLTGSAGERFTNAAMAWGTEKEPEARAAYEFKTEADVSEIGFVDHPVITMTGASPDGLVGDIGLVEIKAPNTATHIETLTSRAVPGRYVTQMQWQMACTGRAWCDFVSYDPRLPHHLSLFIRRVQRDEAMISEMEAEVVRFLAELDAKIAQLLALYGEREAA
jgi:putative phage-type endonuclease